MRDKVSTTDSPRVESSSPARVMPFSLFFLYCNTILADVTE